MAANPSIQLGTDGNWAIKEDNLLAYKKDGTRFFNKEFDFTRNTTATFVDKDGLIKVSATNTPRIDFTDDATGYLLLEPQSTNLITYSEDLSSLNSRNNAVVTSNAVISPSGDLDADKITFDGTLIGRVEQTIAATVGQPYTISVYLKNKDLSDVTQVWIGLSQVGQGQFVTITDEWQRYDITTNADGTSEYPRIQFSGTGSLYAWGFQVEAGSYATSYIPTYGSTVTRAQETCNGAGNASTFNSTEGVLYAEIAALANQANYRYIALTDGTINNRVDILYRGDVANRITSRLTVGGAEAARFDITIDNELNYNKFALSWKQNEVKFFINGTQQGSTDTNANVPPANTLNELMFNRGDGNQQFFGKTKGVYVFNKALTDDELQQLTS